MSIGPAHTYIQEGLKLGLAEDYLESVYRSSLPQKRQFQTYIHSIRHLCHCSQVNYQYLRTVVRRKADCYDVFAVQKRSGGHRYISSPENELKKAQRWINQHLLAQVKPHWRCFSYHSEASIYTAAKEHCGSKWLIKLDIENFFDSVPETIVYKLFRGLGYKPLVSFELARICTIEPSSINSQVAKKWINYNTNSSLLPYKRKNIKYFGRLPQGAPTSPAISNLIFSHIDEVFQQFSEQNKLTYTRYADDLCFSSHERGFDRSCAKLVIDFCTLVLRENGYASNKLKAKIIPPGVRKVVLGLNVNHEKPKLTKAYKSRLEGHIRGIEVFSAISHAKHKGFDSALGMLEHVLGLINHARLVEYSYAMEQLNRFNTAKQKQDFT